MSRLTLISLVLYGLVLIGLATLGKQILALAAPLAVFLLAAVAVSLEKPRLSLQRSLSVGRASPNTPVKVTLRLTNEGESIPQLWFKDELPPDLQMLDGKTSLITWLPGGESAEITYTVQGERGAYHFTDVEAWVSDSLGLVQHRMLLKASQAASVVPDTLRLPHVPLRPRLTKGVAGMIPARQGGPGVTFFGVREYRMGDAMRWINWRASARHRQAVFTNEFEQERAVDICLVLDARLESYLITESSAMFEQAVIAAASLAQLYLNEGDRVGLVSYGAYLSWTFPGYGKIQRERILNALAEARLGESQVEHLSYLPARFLAPGSQIILISPLLKKDLEVLLQMRARGYALLIISPDAVAYESSLLPRISSVEFAQRVARLERVVLLRRLQQAGIRVLNWNIQQPFDQAILAFTRGSARFVERYR